MPLYSEISTQVPTVAEESAARRAMPPAFPVLLRIPAYRIAPELPAQQDEVEADSKAEPASIKPARPRRPWLALSMLAFVVLAPALFMLATRAPRPDTRTKDSAEIGEVMIIPAPGASDDQTTDRPAVELQFSDDDPIKAALVPEIVPLEEGESP